jgi:hypothetical protein
LVWYYVKQRRYVKLPRLISFFGGPSVACSKDRSKTDRRQVIDGKGSRDREIGRENKNKSSYERHISRAKNG